MSTYPIGKCPDGLVPVKASKNRNDNKIKAGQNQGLYISVDVPADQKAGVYTGTINVDVDGVKKDVPISVSVNDVLVNQENHTRAVFLDHWQFWNGEMDSTESMYDKYHRMLGEYRLSPMYAIIESEQDNSDAGMDRYVNKTYEILTTSKVNTMSIPYGTANVQGQTSFDENVMKKYIKKFFDKSIETNYNLLDHLVVYFGFCDEPYEFGLMERAKVIGMRYKVVMDEVTSELAGYRTDSPMHDELIASIAKIRNCITTQYQEEYDEYIDCYCPKARFYDTEEQRAHYDSQKEKWWYTCVDPRMPYPTYHTEDTLSSARMLSWMQANYDVVGNLFWAVNVYAQQGSGGYLPIEDYYTGDAAHYNGCNGDGYLMYPGKQYGIDGPLPSLRLEAIRDGYEEYELFYNLKEKAKSLGLDDKAIFDLITKPLYSGTKVLATAEGVEKARKTLAGLTQAMNNGSDFIVNKCDINSEKGEISFEFYAKNGSEIKVNGEAVEFKENKGAGKIYAYKTTCYNESNDLDIEVKFGENVAHVITHVVGKVSNFTPENLISSFTKYNSSVNATVVDDANIGHALKLEIGKPRDAKQSIKFTPEFLANLNSNSQEIVFNVNNPTNDDLKISFGWRNETNNYDTYLTENMILKPGKTSISTPTLYLRLGVTSNIKYFFLVFGDSSSKTEEAKTFYINNVAIYNK